MAKKNAEHDMSHADLLFGGDLFGTELFGSADRAGNLFGNGFLGGDLFCSRGRAGRGDLFDRDILAGDQLGPGDFDDLVHQRRGRGKKTAGDFFVD